MAHLGASDSGFSQVCHQRVSLASIHSHLKAPSYLPSSLMWLLAASGLCWLWARALTRGPIHRAIHNTAAFVPLRGQRETFVT